MSDDTATQMNLPQLRRVCFFILLLLGFAAVAWILLDAGRGVKNGKEARSEEKTVSRFVVRRGEPLSGGKPVQPQIGRETKKIFIPGPMANFDRWLSAYAKATEEQRAGMLDEGRMLLVARRKAVAELMIADPEAAILSTPTPAMRSLLPVELRGQLEKIVATEGFYGVKAWCNHGTDEVHNTGCRITYEVYFEGRSVQVSIYGSRKQRLSEENASIYGVLLDDRMALHEDDVVVLPASALDPDSSRSGQWALIYKGRTTYVADEASISGGVDQLLGL